MNNQTTVTTVGLAAGVTTIAIWLLGYFFPELMAEAPAGAEAGLTAVISAIIGYVTTAKEQS